MAKTAKKLKSISLKIAPIFLFMVILLILFKNCEMQTYQGSSDRSSQNPANTSNPIENTKIYCEKNQDGWFEVEKIEGESECVRIPNLTYTFTPYRGKELTRPNGDVRTTINLNFDTVISKISGDGVVSPLTKSDVLEMLQIKPLTGNDLVASGGSIDVDEINIINTAGRTVIKVSPPNGDNYTHTLPLNSYSVNFKNFVSKFDSSRFENVSDNSLSEFLKLVDISYPRASGGFFTVDKGNSCDLPSALGINSIRGQSKGTDNAKQTFCGADFLDIPKLSSASNLGLTMAIRDQIQPRVANQNQTYEIKIAFVYTDSFNFNEAFMTDEIIPNVNQIFQDSGVNVEFEVAGFIPYSNVRTHLLCNIDLDGLHANQGLAVIEEIAPMIQNEYDADLVYAIHDYADSSVCGIAFRRTNIRYPLHHSTFFASRWASVGSVDYENGCNTNFRSNDLKKASFISTLTHEIGHNLGLNHSKDIIEHASRNYPDSFNFHSDGYGFSSATSRNCTDGNSTFPCKYGTIMSYSGRSSFLPIFSSNESLDLSEICGESDRFDNDLGYGFCPNIYESGHPDETVWIGGSTTSRDGNSTVIVDSAEALQNAVADASTYNTVETVQTNKTLTAE